MCLGHLLEQVMDRQVADVVSAVEESMAHSGLDVGWASTLSEAWCCGYQL